MKTTLNKHGIPVQTKTARQQRVEMLAGIKLSTRRFALIDDEEIHISEIMQMNIDKLKTRYPDKFSVEDSIKRVDVNG